MKKRVKLSESQLKAIIAESVENVLNEIGDTPAGAWMAGRLKRRQDYRNKGRRTKGLIKKTTAPVDRRDYLFSPAYHFGEQYEDDLMNVPPGGYYPWDDYSGGYAHAMEDMIRQYRRSKGIED